MALKRRNPEAEAERFAAAMLRPGKGGRLSPGDLRGAYIDWCERSGKQPLPIEDIAPALGKLFRKAGIEIADGEAIGVTIKS